MNWFGRIQKVETFSPAVESPKTGWMPCGAREANWGCPP